MVALLSTMPGLFSLCAATFSEERAVCIKEACLAFILLSCVSELRRQMPGTKNTLVQLSPSWVVGVNDCILAVTLWVIRPLSPPLQSRSQTKILSGSNNKHARGTLVFSLFAMLRREGSCVLDQLPTFYFEPCSLSTALINSKN